MSDAIDLPDGSPLATLVHRSPTLVIFLRSFGCTFCREAMADVAALRPKIHASGTEVAFVHSESEEVARPWFAKYQLEDTLQVSDPSLTHYRAFGLGHTGASALVDPVVWVRGAVSAFAHGFGPQSTAMLRQLPGVFIVSGHRLLASFRHRSAADRPDYLELIRSSRASRGFSSDYFRRV